MCLCTPTLSFGLSPASLTDTLLPLCPMQVLSASPLHNSLLFSSIASLTGPAGSTNYAAANGILDGSAAALGTAGLPVTSVQWGAWSDIGMVASNQAVHRAMERSGVSMVTPQQGLRLMLGLLRSGDTGRVSGGLVAAIPFLWQRFMQQPKNTAMPFYGEFAAQAPALGEIGAMHEERGSATRADRGSAAAASLCSIEEVADRVARAVAAVNGGEVGPATPLVQAGIDSLGEFNGYSRRVCKTKQECWLKGLMAAFPNRFSHVVH